MFLNILNSFYSPQHNLIFVNTIKGVNANIVLVFVIVAVALFIKVFLRSLSLRRPAICAAGLIVFCFVFGLQTINYARYLWSQQRVLSGKTYAQKERLLFGDIPAYARFCRQTVDGPGQGILVTDINLRETTGVYQHLALAYHLAPLRIQSNPRQIRINPRYVLSPSFPQKVEFLFYYKKINPEPSLPAAFSVVKRFDKNSLVAQRK